MHPQEVPVALGRLVPPAYRPVLANRVFRRLIIGFGVSYLGDGMSFGFGVTLRYSDETSVARAENASHPIFQGPFLPVGTTWTGGAFGHATVSGAGLTPLLANSGNDRSVLGEKGFGNGWVIFGGMTTDNNHQPQPEAQNLRANILAYANGQIIPPANLPPAILTQPASQAVLAGQTVTLNASAYGSRPLSLQWFFNGQLLPNATNASLILTSVTTNQAGGYKLVASNALGVATSERATLTVSLQGPRITLHPISRSGGIRSSFRRSDQLRSEATSTGMVRRRVGGRVGVSGLSGGA